MTGLPAFSWISECAIPPNGLQEFSARSSPAHRSLKWPTKLICKINKEKHCNVFFFFTRESSFWFLAFGGFFCYCEGCWKTSETQLFRHFLCFLLCIALLCTVCNANLGRIDISLWLAAGLS